MKRDKRNMFEFVAEIAKIGNRAIRKAQEENRRLDLPNVYSKNGRVYYQLPDGTITEEKPEELENS